MAATSQAASDEQVKTANASIDKAIAFLRKSQNQDGSWSPKAGPAVTALIVTAMIDRPEIKASDPTVAKAVKYIVSKAKKDGSIHDGILINYNTSISLSALARFNDDPKVATVIKNGLQFLRNSQYAGQTDEKGQPIDPKHAFYGGWGYGKHGRPDGSNSQITVQAFYDNNVECDKDPAVKRALTFFHRLQGIKSNDKNGDKIVNDGGAIYATSVNKDLIGVPQSMASPELIDEAKLGKPVAGLRTYGSMTYAMFKTYIYANLKRDDPRVKEAFKWVQNNYTVDQNPGMPEDRKMQGYYYYVITFARALHAWDSKHEGIKTADGKLRHWDSDLIKKLVSLQNKDGSWTNEADRWYEGDPNVVTAYAVIALQHAAR